ncbi:hypothetical protein [Kingella oralis]|jgi:hypothetical protein|uniref:hypothetical protein n=1 Tax=Kingella oralis TaxID=505 RepID=UPI0028E3B5E6|nr:hypothetical protein [Kingella oralis]
MKINKKFNQMSIAEYHHYIAHHQKYADFNPLGLYRSILENPKLNEAAQLEVLALANRHFQRFYDFLFAKDPFTYSRLATLGQGLSETALRQHLRDTWDRREKWCAEKDIRLQRIGIGITSQYYFADANEATGYRIERYMNRPLKLRQPENRLTGKQQRKREAHILRQAWQESDEE